MVWVLPVSLDQPSLYHSHWVLASSTRSGSAPTGRRKKASRDGTGAGVSAGGLTSRGCDTGLTLCFAFQAGGQAAHPERLAVPPGARDHPPAVPRHGGGQAALLQALGRLRSRVGAHPAFESLGPGRGPRPRFPLVLLGGTGHLPVGQSGWVSE